MSANVTFNADPIQTTAVTLDPVAPGVLARGTYDELRSIGLTDVDVMAFAGELLALVAKGVQQEPQS